MPYQRVRDILDKVREFHQQVRAWCAQQGEVESDPRAESMIRFIEGYEQDFQKTLSQFTEGGQDTLLDTWIQNVPDREVREALEETTIEPKMPVEAVVTRVVEFDRALVAFYRNLAATLIPPRVADAFASLADSQESKSREYSRRLNEWADQ